jgi:hypothetical protein
MQKLVITLVLIAAAAQLAYARPQPVPPKTALQPCSVTGAVTDLLMSDDMGKYLAHEGKGLVHDEGDME